MSWEFEDGGVTLWQTVHLFVDFPGITRLQGHSLIPSPKGEAQFFFVITFITKDQYVYNLFRPNSIS